jgi:hypothetical protein
MAMRRDAVIHRRRQSRNASDVADARASTPGGALLSAGTHSGSARLPLVRAAAGRDGDRRNPRIQEKPNERADPAAAR